jgi:dipeptidyl aminopeptidase/acylaminoacyl peptidase
VVAAALVLLAAVVGTVGTLDTPAPPTEELVELPPPRTEALAEPAENGLIAYSYEGDIYVGDPVTGETTAIVTGSEHHTNPIFSPDGTRIAFVRGDPFRDARVVVVQPDGSDERVVIPKEPKVRAGLGPFAWTPDGASLVVEHDREATPYYDGLLSLFDASGTVEPRLLSPPLPAKVGAMYFNASAQVAPMFRPPRGDRIVADGDADGEGLKLFDADLAAVTRIGRESLGRYEPYSVYGPTWSPDGAMIAFDLVRYDATNQYTSGLFVLNADDGGLRRIGRGRNLLWSPDGSRVAFERWSADEKRAVIVVIDLSSGSRRVLEGTTTVKKRGAPFQTITNNIAHEWFYEAWSWTPDGRSLLILERHRTRPLVVDIETGEVTRLPWEADSAPSWQRVPSG